MALAARVRANAAALVAALVSVPVMIWLGLTDFAWNDYYNEAAPAYAALVHGHLDQFLRLLPAYGGSLILRAPFALLPGTWGGGDLAVYRAVAIPCLAAAGAFAVWLAAQMRALGHTRLARGAAVGLCVASPISLLTLEYGHPEDLLGAVLCVSAICAAMRGRSAIAGVLLGLAVSNKAWALLAAGPVLLALPSWRAALRMTAASLAVALPLLLPELLVSGGHFASAGTSVLTHSSVIFQPQQLWWFVGRHAGTVYGELGGVKAGYRTPPAWLSPLVHPLIVLLAVPLTLVCFLRPREQRDPLLLAVLLFALRSALDTWDVAYYLLPFSFTLLTWEVLVRREAPVLALITVCAVWVDFHWSAPRLTPDAQALLYGVVAVPVILLIAVRLYAPGLLRARRRGSLALAGPA